jgi:hypothetical protein
LPRTHANRREKEYLEILSTVPWVSQGEVDDHAGEVDNRKQLVLDEAVEPSDDLVLVFQHRCEVDWKRVKVLHTLDGDSDGRARWGWKWEWGKGY